jgi:hypothetical protein
MVSGVLRLICFSFAFGITITGCRYVSDARQSSQEAAFTTNDVAYEPGEEVVLTLRNVYDQSIGYNLCTSGLQHNVNDTWEPVEEDRACTLQLNTLDPGEVDTFPLALPESLANGAYRYSTGVQGLDDTNEPPGPDQVLTTNPFQVE